MSFLETLGLPDPRKVAREVRSESSDPVVLASLEPMVHNAEARLANKLRGAVSARVSTDPAVLALSDQFEAELVDTARRGRRA